MTGMTLTADDPDALSRRWAAVLGAERSDGAIALDGGELRFEAGHRDGIAAFHVEGIAHDVDIGGVTFVAR